MANPKIFAWLLFVFVIGHSVLHAQKAALPDASDAVAGMGINIHFTDAQPGEMEMLTKAGFHWVRMDLTWANTEKAPGVYDFSAYDRLMASLDKFHIRALLILDYANPLYDNGLASHTDEGRAAFARWAVAAVTHFKDRGVLWEIWNEPNGAWFWKPDVNPVDYTKLALIVNKSLRQAAPNELIVGPGLAGIQFQFVDVLATMGVLEDWSAITIHPYRHTGPESYGPAYEEARTIIKRCARPGHPVEVICGESGYTTTWPGIDETLQAKYLARLYLFDVLSGIPVTIWYDWHDDGPDPTNQEDRYGIAHSEYHAGAENVYDPKPAYDAARTYSEALTGYTLKKRIKTISQNDYVLSFTNGTAECLAAWTTSLTPHNVTIAAPDGIYLATSFDGKKQVEVASTNGVLILTLDDGPQYLKRE